MMRAQPVFMMRGYSPQDMSYPWSLSGREGVRRPLRVRILHPEVNPQQASWGSVYNQPGQGHSLCPDVMEEIVSDYLRRHLNGVRQNTPTTVRNGDCCGKNNNCGTRPKCTSGANATRCQKTSRHCPGTGCPSGPQATNGAHSGNPRGPSTRVSLDHVQRQQQPETVSLDTLMEHVFGEIFGRSSRDESPPADDGAATKSERGDKHPETKTTGDSEMKKQRERTSVGEAKSVEPKTEDTSPNKTNTGENLRHSGAMSLHDVLGIMFSDLFGHQRCESSDECRQDDTNTKRTCKSSSSVPASADVDSKSQSPTPGVGECSVHGQPQALDLQAKSEIEAGNTENDSDITDDATSQVLMDNTADDSDVTDDATSQVLMDNTVDDNQDDNSETDEEHSEYDMIEGADDFTQTSLVDPVDDTDAVHNERQVLDDNYSDNKDDGEDDDDFLNESHQDSRNSFLMPVTRDIPSPNNIEPKTMDPEQFRMSFDLNGFSADDIHVSLSQDKLTVKASRETEANGLTTEHSTQRSLTLPPGVDADSLRCRLDDDGHMTVSADYIQNNKGPKLLTIEKVTEN